jgi:hypothetical protein
VKEQARPCEDRHQLCRKWKDQGACELDRHFFVSEKDPLNGQVVSQEMFQFMAAACPAMCGFCGKKVSILLCSMLHFLKAKCKN